MPAGKGRYTIGGKGTYGCSGYPVVGGEGKVHGCHETRAQAQAQQAAIYASEAQKGIDSEDFYKAWSVQENNPECDGFAVVGDSGTIYGCFKTREEAAAAVTAHNNDKADEGMDDNEDNDLWRGSAFDTSFAKRDYSTSERRRLAAAGAAMPDGSFPIANRRDLQNAIQSVGRASNYESAKRHIIRRARALGLTNMLPEEWMNG